EIVGHGTSCLESDREALLDLKNGFEDPDQNPRLLTWKGSDCCQWWGIHCGNTTGAVTHVDLHNPYPFELGDSSKSRYGFWNLSGEIRPSLAKLKSLKYLDLSFNTLNGISIPTFLGSSLQNLQYLNLSHAGLSGRIPRNLGNLSNLQYLDLSSNYFNSKIPDWLVNVSSLKTIDMTFCELQGKIPLGLSDLPNLRTLRLRSNWLLTSSTSQLFRGRWEKVQILDLGYSRIQGKLPTSIGNMTSLTYLDLSRNDIQGGIPRSIAKLCNLKHLDLSFNNLTGTLPESLEESRYCVSSSLLFNLRYLDLSYNQLSGRLPEWLGHLENLIELILHDNLLHGPIPNSLHLLQNLKELKLQQNRLNGTIPQSIGQLPELSILDVSSNYLTGLVTEKHFMKHTMLEYLDLSFNSFKLDVGLNWAPPFQIRFLRLSSCHLGSCFPAWLRPQKKTEHLVLSNASISGPIPEWFWENSPKFLNFSFNKLGGQLPNSFNTGNTYANVDFSYNLFEGSITLPVGNNVMSLDLSNNKFSVIDLSSNKLTGIIPASIGNLTDLRALDLSKNSLFGKIPSTLGQLIYLLTLHLGENKLSGQIPSLFRNLSRLTMLDLGSNKLKGRIPSWTGECFKILSVLSLRSNEFFGELPFTLSNLSSLRVLDLAENQLNGIIPASFGDFKCMTQIQNISENKFYGVSSNSHYDENMVVNMKGQSLRYTKTLSLVIGLDLSSNNFSGDFPVEITKLLGLVVLNLSGNHISGHIPINISKLGQLSSLDLSSNRLSGPIPESLSSLSFLGHLNLSNNEFSGVIPYAGHMTTFDASSFTGNPGLCGGPLDSRCPGDKGVHDGSSKEQVFEDNFLDEWFYLSVGLGFAAGLLVPFLVMSLRKSWSDAYFGLVDMANIIVEQRPQLMSKALELVEGVGQLMVPHITEW
ncbi:Leucine-rich repeat domain containing protein, partial [Parasponia andersonii]